MVAGICVCVGGVTAYSNDFVFFSKKKKQKKKTAPRRNQKNLDVCEKQTNEPTPTSQDFLNTNIVPIALLFSNHHYALHCVQNI